MQPAIGDLYKHQILNITYQSLKLYEKSLMTQYIHVAVLYVYVIYTLTLVADLEIIQHANIRLSYSKNVVILRFFPSTSKAAGNKQN